MEANSRYNIPSKQGHAPSEMSQGCKTISRETTPTKTSHPDDKENEKNTEKVIANKSVTIKEKSRSNSPASRQSPPKHEQMKRKDSQAESTKSENKGPSLRTKQVTFMLFIITVVFVLSFIPHLVLMVINAMNPLFVKDMSPVGIAFYHIFLRSFVINNMANPIIYGFCDKKFRTECTDLGLDLIACFRS